MNYGRGLPAGVLAPLNAATIPNAKDVPDSSPPTSSATTSPAELEGRFHAAMVDLYKRSQNEAGYTLSVKVATPLLGDPPALSVEIEDHDAGHPEGASVRLWAGGHPVTGRKAKATPVAGPGGAAPLGAAP